jgi:hypothetical protein
MAEATDRSSLPATGGPADESPRPYSSVSYLAIGGLIISVAYAGVMAIGAGIALLNRTPWILPVWTFVFPLGAALLCWAARVRIHNSEDSLTGAALTAWGLWLTLSFGLIYAAYYSACYLSITGQATTFSDGWFDDLKKDQLDLAYLKSLAPPRPAADAQLRDRLELDHNSGPEGKGPFTEFRQSQLVRELEQGGGADQVQNLGIQSWGYEQGGYQVQILYRVTTPSMTSEFLATAFGVENEESGARQWYIKNIQPNAQPMLTDEGRRMTRLTEDARSFAQNWLNDVYNWDWDKAYLDTLPPAERQEQGKQPRGDAFHSGMKAFRQGNVIRAEPGVFWASPKEKDKIISGVRGIFGTGKTPERLSLQGSVPVYHRDADRVTFRFDLTILLPPQYGVQSQVVVTADARNGDPTPADWRVESLELISGKTLTAGAPGPGGSPAATPALTPQRPH